MPDLESHSGQRLDCQNLFIDVDARWSTTSSR
jgi:hypothetical protein